MGHEVTLFEALHVAGGVLSYGIPEFRLPKDIVKREVEYVQSLGVDLRLGNLIGRIHTIPELLAQWDTMPCSSAAGLGCLNGPVARERTWAAYTRPTSS